MTRASAPTFTGRGAGMSAIQNPFGQHLVHASFGGVGKSDTAKEQP